MSRAVVAFIIDEVITIIAWVCFGRVIHDICMISGDFTGFAIFNTCMLLLTAAPLGLFALMNR